MSADLSCHGLKGKVSSDRFVGAGWILAADREVAKGQAYPMFCRTWRGENWH